MKIILAFVASVIFRNLDQPYIPCIQFMVDAPAVRKGNVLVTFAAHQRLHLFLRFRMDESSDIMLFIKKICDFEFIHRLFPPILTIFPSQTKKHETVSADWGEKRTNKLLQPINSVLLPMGKTRWIEYDLLIAFWAIRYILQLSLIHI